MTAATRRCRRLLFARDDDGQRARRRAPPCRPTRPPVARFRELAGVERRAWSVPRADSSPGPATSSRPPRSRRPRSTATLDWWWRRTSFCDITAGTYEPHVASEPEEAARRRRVRAGHAPPRRLTIGRDALRAVPSLLADMPVGVEVGTLVHRVFEAVDFTAAGSLLGARVSRSLPPRPGGGSSSATRTRSSRGCTPRSRRRWGTALRSGTSPVRTASTSSTSSSRWSAATTRAAPL